MDLEPYVIAYKMQKRQEVELANLTAWMQGAYFRTAITSSVFATVMLRKNTRLPPYPAEPLEIDLDDDSQIEEEKTLTEEQIEAARLRERIKMDNLCRAINKKFSQGR